MNAKPEFDPYHLWLGIPAAEQPPNHYRLLGVTLFETNADVIDAAAFRQTVHLRTYALGPRSDVSQKLLNEVATAKNCLMRPEKRAAYDAELMARLATAKELLTLPLSAIVFSPPPASAGDPTPDAGMEPPPVNRPSRQTQPIAVAAESPSLPPWSASLGAPMRSRHAKRPKAAAGPWIVASIAVAAAILLGVLFYGDLGRSEKPIAKNSSSTNDDSDPSPKKDDSDSDKPATKAASPTKDDSSEPRAGGKFDFDFSGEPGKNFTAINDGGPFGVTARAGGLRIAKPVDDGSVEANGFIEAGLLSRFTIIGDFTATVGFTLYDMPIPGDRHQLNESLFAIVADGDSLYQVLRFTIGDGRSLVEGFANPDAGLSSLNSSLASGVYRISRSGPTISGWISPPGGLEFISLGSAGGLAGPMRVKLYAAQGTNGGTRSTTALDVGFDSLVIQADELRGIAPAP